MLAFPISCLSQFVANLPLCLSGQNLFQNSQISSSKNVSCAACHNPQSFFSNWEMVPIVRQKYIGKQKTPRVWNLSFGPFFYNGRAKTLQGQTFWPLFHKDELDSSPEILAHFGGPTFVSGALAEFIRSLKSPHTTWDTFQENSKSAALLFSKSELQGMQLFFGKMGCSSCHNGETFRGNRLASIKYPKFVFEEREFKESTYLSDVNEIKGEWAHSKAIPSGLRGISNQKHFGRFGAHSSLHSFLEFHKIQTENEEGSEVTARKDINKIVDFLNVL
jgi:cytochrome c peroxidase